MSSSTQQPTSWRASSSDLRSSPLARVAKVSFWILVAGLLPLMVSASRDFGATWDESDRHENGRRVLEYFQGSRTREEAHWGTMYPALFDVIPAWLEQHVDADRYVIRHRVNAVFGWIGLLFSGLLALRLFGSSTAILAVILLATSPRYFAHSMNNPKDLPFAAMSVVALYGMSFVSPQWPYVTAGAGAAVAVGLGLALGTRPGALLYFGYLPLLVFALAAVQRITRRVETLEIDWRLEWRSIANVAVRVALVLAAGLLVGTIFWPWAQAAPLSRPFDALSRASDYREWDSNVIFAGLDYQASDLPGSYLPTWFIISMPPVVLVGLILSIVSPARGWGLRRLALAAVAALPIALIVLRHSTVYDGMRHTLFAYPPMAILAATGWAAVLTHRQRWLRAAGLALLIAGLANVMAFNLRAYPNQAAYVNELVGGPKGAFGRYELDYWGNCMLQAVEWSASQARQAGMPVIVWGRPQHILELDAARFPEVKVAASVDDPHHLQIHLLRDAIKDLREMTTWTSVHRVTTPDGAVLCGVYPGRDFDELQRRLQASPRPPS
jgi:hypothetical protein